MSTFRGGASDTLGPDALDPVARSMPPAPRGEADIRVLRVPIPTRWSLIHSAARLVNAASVGISNKKLLVSNSFEANHRVIGGSSPLRVAWGDEDTEADGDSNIVLLKYDDYYDGIPDLAFISLSDTSLWFCGPRQLTYTHYTR